MTPPDLKADFHWYWWDSGNSCVQHDRRPLDILVKTLPCLFERREPVTPQRRDITKADGTKDYELRLLCCPTCTPRVCFHGNLYDWFIAWPTTPGQAIQQGHAKGWKIVGEDLVTPGPEAQTLDFDP